MEEKPRVVIRRARQEAPVEPKFRFSEGNIRPGALFEFRQRAWECFASLPMPSVVEDAWRRTDPRLMPVDSFQMQEGWPEYEFSGVPKDLLKPLVADNHGGQIILTPGGVDQQVDPALLAQGVIFTDLRTAEREYPELVTRLAGQAVRAEEGKFAAMAAALAQNGIFLYVPKEIKVELPLHGILWNPGEALAHIRHVIVCLEDGASVTYVQEMASPDGGKGSLHVANIEILIGAGADLRFVELQSLGNEAWNVSHERVVVGNGGKLDWIFGAVGSHLTKNFSEIDLAGEGASGRMSGFYFANGNQHLDHDTQQNHHAPHTTSDLLFKGALKGQSRSVWQGMIYVAPGANKTDGYQANRNIVLSPLARADSIPGLEILADDVRCTHGATVSRLEDEPLFYLMSRGIAREEAEQMLVEGFFDPIMQRIPFEGVRERFQQAIHRKMMTD